MVKKFLLFAVLLVAGAIVVLNHSDKESGMDDLVLENVEALARYEGGFNDNRCLGVGSVVCPVTSLKVAWVWGRSIFDD